MLGRALLNANDFNILQLKSLNSDSQIASSKPKTHPNSTLEMNLEMSSVLTTSQMWNRFFFHISPPYAVLSHKFWFTAVPTKCQARLRAQHLAVPAWSCLQAWTLENLKFDAFLKCASRTMRRCSPLAPCQQPV